MSQPTPPYDPNAQQPYQAPAPGYQQPYAQQPYGQPPASTAYPQQAYGYGYAQPAPANNSMALVSLIASIGGFTLLPFIGSIVAVITGHMAKKQIAQTGEGGGGMATAGLVIGYIGIGLGVLIVIIWIAAVGLIASTGELTYG